MSPEDFKIAFSPGESCFGRRQGTGYSQGWVTRLRDSMDPKSWLCLASGTATEAPGATHRTPNHAPSPLGDSGRSFLASPQRKQGCFEQRVGRGSFKSEEIDSVI